MTTFATGITRTFDSPYYTGTASTLSSGGVSSWDVALNGIGYMLDLQNPNAEGYKYDSIPMLHAMFLQDRQTQPIGEHSLTPYDYWRRSYDDFKAGSGQLFADHHDSVGDQYRTSTGIDPWTEGQFSMLHDTASKLTSANANLQCVVAGSYLYVLDGTALKYTQSLAGTPSFTTVTPAGGDATLSSATSMVSDGYTVWVSDANRVHYTTRGNATFDKYHTADQASVDRLGFAKGRLFTTIGRTIYTHSGANGSAVATSYFQHPNVDWVWTAIAEGNNSIYFAGFSGHVSYIYAATIKADGTNLDVPVAVSQLPAGEIVRSLRSYFNVLIVGTDLGWRGATINASAGDLTIGSLVQMANPPKCFETHDRFIWFGWTNYDGTHTGLGRIDVSTDNGTSNQGFLPAYASDLMAVTQGTVASVVTFQAVRVFAVAAVGLYQESANKVTTGTISSGYFNFELADEKLAVKANVQYKVGAGMFSFGMAVDDQASANYGNVINTSPSAGGSAIFQLPQLRGRQFEWTLTLTRSSSDHTAGPVIDRVTFMVEPIPNRRSMFTVPILLHHQVKNQNGLTVRFSPSLERNRFFELFQSRQVVSYQDIEQSWPVIIDDFNWVPYEDVGLNTVTWDGTMVLKLKVID